MRANDGQQRLLEAQAALSAKEAEVLELSVQVRVGGLNSVSCFWGAGRL